MKDDDNIIRIDEWLRRKQQELKQAPPEPEPIRWWSAIEDAIKECAMNGDDC